ncbi:hypothetical protein [Flavihumibacter petaseus]|uniref:Uncharacterized protein n=1 Tax=Flavihumibacter petaseus NBRC 106054 TaxID=1220578 RepID=A0A0E9N5R5_9BACT|nr:hypothetical protein [Flavihumibacter petaseus]GAO44685.1 hypothetical protein FPE01S_03_07240 [Flavihumibacter petaseus NBRC 106054]
MKGKITIVLLLLSLVTFFVIRPFIVDGRNGLPGMITAVLRVPHAPAPQQSVLKKDEAAHQHALHMSACDDTNFRKVASPTLFKLFRPVFHTPLLLLLGLAIIPALIAVIQPRGLFEILPQHRHFDALCLLRI